MNAEEKFLQRWEQSKDAVRILFFVELQKIIKNGIKYTRLLEIIEDLEHVKIKYRFLNKFFQIISAASLIVLLVAILLETELLIQSITLIFILSLAMIIITYMKIIYLHEELRIHRIELMHCSEPSVHTFSRLFEAESVSGHYEELEDDYFKLKYSILSRIENFLIYP